MTLIFECETVVGKCCCEAGDGELLYAEPDYAVVYASTVARLNGHRGMLKVEHECSLRHGRIIPAQPWIEPTVRLEAAVGSREHLLQAAQAWHAQFVARVKKEFPEEYLV